MSLNHLILGILSQESLSGYDINKRFLESVEPFWTTDQSQIYRALHRMREKGLVRVEHVVQADVPDKKVYHLTEAGQAELDTWLTTPLTARQAPIREGWLGQLFFADNVPDATLVKVLETYRDEVGERVAALEAAQAVFGESDGPGIARGDRLRLMTLEYGIAVQQAVRDWLNEAIARVQRFSDL
jgi:DNA-binding PadR family transcriptional regulator